jgi:hypothetical protein
MSLASWVGLKLFCLAQLSRGVPPYPHLGQPAWRHRVARGGDSNMAIFNWQCLGLAAGFLVASTMNAAAGTTFNFSGNHLLQACRGTYGFCVGYVTGIAKPWRKTKRACWGFTHVKPTYSSRMR